MPAPLSASELASQYGFALSFINSDASLKKLFQDAVKNNYTVEKFQALLRNTSFYKQHSETVRQYRVLATTDPATLQQRRNQVTAQIRDTATALGAGVPSKTLAAMAEHAIMFNWNDSQIRDTLSGYVHAVNGVYNGQAATDIDALRQTAWRNGVHMPAATLQNWAQQIAKGTGSLSFFQQYIKKQAQSLAPGYSAELEGGMDLYDIASPFVQAKAKILEKNPADIDLFDSDIRNALSGTTRDGKPASQSLWQFEQAMRQKPEWLKTSNAQDSTMSTARKVLSDFGFSSV